MPSISSMYLCSRSRSADVAALHVQHRGGPTASRRHRSVYQILVATACALRQEPTVAARAVAAPFSFLGYQEFIGAKKHLVLALLSHTGPPQRSNSFAIG